MGMEYLFALFGWSVVYSLDFQLYKLYIGICTDWYIVSASGQFLKNIAPEKLHWLSEIAHLFLKNVSRWLITRSTQLHFSRLSSYIVIKKCSPIAQVRFARIPELFSPTENLGWYLQNSKLAWFLLTINMCKALLLTLDFMTDSSVVYI